ncbi:ABC transporter substrate-binding protein [Nonomuraea gerenzanensis]|uniref:Benzoate transport, extracellular ligand-binding receptor n=1 Tax=Nonomuraea gerenzanensis TaxID=93944 RepID=A0A1M4DWB4_9ACTN|nr:ABC transporter substrate-binding protein [Nonomuraea gerenzanensis]UBU13209.1 ABC transporter substrate-binding protein [Nonomuraea gerenzanensis]SBO90859.1 Benzoate transport, extracellular ligand-binding receptor [Nonomuraea gerenzanensis]
MRAPVLGLPVVGLAVLMAAGCGGTVPPPDEDTLPVKIGAIISQTGVYAMLGDDMETAMRLYLDDHGGRLGGRRAELLVADDAGVPEQARKEARRLIDAEEVDVLTGLIASPVAVSVVEEAGRTPVVVANAGADELDGPNVFRVSYTNHAHGHAAGRYAAERYGRSGAVLMASDYSAGVETLAGFTEGYGAEPLKRILTPYGRVTDLRPYFEQIPRQARLLFAFYAGGEAVAFTRAFKQLGYDSRLDLLACMNLTDEDVLRAVGPDAEGVTSVGMYSPALDNPDNAAFVARWRARTGRNPSAVALQSWDAVRLIDAALARGGELTRALGEVGELAGPRGRFRLDGTHNPVQNWYARQYENGVNRVISTIPP